MAITLATGSQPAIASTYGASYNITALSNAAEAVATVQAGHGISQGEYLEITSGWDYLTMKIVRAKTVNVNDVTLEGINTTNTTKYPAGTGTGSVRRITAWANLSQIKGITPSGGDQQYTDITTIVDQIKKQIPTQRNPVTMTMDFFDDPTLSWYATVSAASDSATGVGFLLSFPNGSKLVANAYWSLQKTPNVASAEPLTSKIDLSYAADPVRYST
jgi:hypothetical protein